MLPELEIDASRTIERVESFIARVVADRRAEGVVLGLSGGIDSAVVAALCVRALSPSRVTALFLPERDTSSSTAADARLVAGALGLAWREENLTPALEALGCYRGLGAGIVRVPGLARAVTRALPGGARKRFAASLSGEGGREARAFVAFSRIKHRVRLVRCYREAEERNALVASCANRTEHETGFFVRYGDDSGDIAPIVTLYKTQVFAVAAALGLPKRVLEKPPSPDLFGAVADEEILGVRYETLDAILALHAGGAGEEETAARVGADAETVRYVRRLSILSERQRAAPLAPPPFENS